MAEALTKYFPEDGDPEEELSQEKKKLRLDDDDEKYWVDVRPSSRNFEN